MNQKVMPLLVVLLTITAFMGGFWLKGKMTSKSIVETPGSNGVTVTVSPTENVLSISNLKKYSVGLGLDTQKFNQCLDNGERIAKVKEDQDLANSLNVNGTPGFFINGRFLGGAFPFEIFKEIIDKELAGKGSSQAKDYSQSLQQYAISEQGRPPAFVPKPVIIKVGDEDPQLGGKNAKVTIVEFSDFQCPFCVRAYSTVKQIEQSYGDKVKIVFKNLPLQIHQYAQKAAEASLCANDQGKFWEYHDKIFSLESSGQ